MQIEDRLPRGHFFALSVCPLAAWGRGRSAEGPALGLPPCYCPFIYLPASLQGRSGAGLGQRSPHTLSPAVFTRGSLRGQSKLQDGAHGQWLGDGTVEGGGGHCCQATGRGIYICPSSPLHPVTWVTATCSWASRSQRRAQLEPTCQTSFPGIPSTPGGAS